jgi:hypothetical protein
VAFIRSCVGEPLKRSVGLHIMTSTDTARLTKKLEERVQFIRRSSEAYDQGSEEEALRIATSLRVVFHQTGASTSLITHLGFGAKKLLSSSRGHGDWKDYLAHEINLNSPVPIRMWPILGDKFHELSIDDWWQNETVFVHNGTNHTRRKIILSAANKDGGAHVDADLELDLVGVNRANLFPDLGSAANYLAWLVHQRKRL